MRPKAQIVTQSGEADPRSLPRGWRVTTFPDGTTQVAVSVPPSELPGVHAALLGVLGKEIGLMQLRLTDRQLGQLAKPERRVAMNLPADRVLVAINARSALVYEDGRHQLWARGALGEQVVLDELGLVYCYPDDPGFRDVMSALVLPETTAPMACDEEHFPYVRVNFLAEADEQERSLWDELHMVKWQ